MAGHGVLLEATRVEWMRRQRWFAGRTRGVRTAAVLDRVRIGRAALDVVAVDYADGTGDADRYVVALGPGADVADAFDDPGFCRALLDLVRRDGEATGDRGAVRGRRGGAFPAELATEPAARRLTGEQ